MHVRRLDNLGRLVIPAEMREILGLHKEDPCILRLNEAGNIEVEKYAPSCVFCGSGEGVVTYKEKCVCQGCIDGLSKSAE